MSVVPTESSVCAVYTSEHGDNKIQKSAIVNANVRLIRKVVGSIFTRRIIRATVSSVEFHRLKHSCKAARKITDGWPGLEENLCPSHLFPPPSNCIL